MKQLLFTIFLFVSFSALGQKSLKKADRAYDKLEYYDAINYYIKYLEKNEDVFAKSKLADCYLRTNQYQEATNIYQSIENDLDSSNSRLKYGNALLILGMVDDAKLQAQKFLKKDKENIEGLLLLKSCNLMDQFISNENNFDIIQSDFTAGISNFSPMYYQDKLMFTTDQGGKIDRWTGRSYSNIYSYDPESKLSVPIEGDLNGKYHNGVVSFVNDAHMIYTRNSEQKNDQNDYNLLLAEAILKNGEWNFKKYFEYNNEEEYNVAYPSVSSDGSFLIFASDMKGGAGGWDLYRCDREGDAWSTPINLSLINTSGNEMFPNLTENQLTFSSDGYPGMGGLDIYKTDIIASKKATNLGAPFNSHRDDFGLITNDDMKSGYFCSNRNDSKGLDHIFRFTKNAEALTLTGIVLDEYTRQPLKETIVTLTNTLTGEKVDVITKLDGRFSFQVYSDQAYELQGIKNTILTTQEVMDLRASEKEDLYFTLLHNDPRFSLEGYAQNAKDQSGVVDVNVSRFNNTQNENLIDVSKANGFFKFQLEQDSDFEISGEKDGHYTSVSTASTKGLNRSKTLYVKLFLTMEEVIIGETKILGKEKIGGWSFDPIYYDLDKDEIRYDASIVLDKLVDFLNQNPGLVIELGSHTDSRGKDLYNEDLSSRRAASAVRYLVGKGIDANRLQSKGYGEYALVNQCTNDVKCSEEEHQLNRRTEIKVIANTN